MPKKSLTDPEKAQKYLLKTEESEFEVSLLKPLEKGLIRIILLFYSAKGQLTRLIQKDPSSFSETELENFKNNNSRLENLKHEVLTDNFEQLLKKYNEAVILSALVNLIRENEANIITFDKYNLLKEKFINWPKIGITNGYILQTWKDFSIAIHEVEAWLQEKKDSYLKIVEKLIANFESDPQDIKNEFYKTLSEVPEKEAYYVICNVLLTNPLLRNEFLTISMLSKDKLETFDKNLYQTLDILYNETNDKALKGIIFLFKLQIKDQRPELEQ